MSPEKSRLEQRKEYIRIRDSLSPAERAEKSRRAAERIAALPEFRSARTVMLYRAVRGELSPESLTALPVSAGKRFVYPRCVSRTEMEVLLPGGWETGAFGIPEPAAETSERILPEEIDLVVCPGTAFDPSGTRLGMGAGYYDRFLPGCVNAVFVLAAFEAQRAPLLPRNLRDVPMDLIVTEEAVYRIPDRPEPPERPEKKIVRVSAAVIRDEDRLFATQRGYGPWKDFWEFPGGKIEPGETPEKALEREIREELDTEIAVGRKLAQVEYEYPEFHLSMGCFLCDVVFGSLILKEHESARWLRKEELGSVDWLPADLDLIRRIAEGEITCG
jgi:8-oxo-dGTP diphosphatase